MKIHTHTHSLGMCCWGENAFICWVVTNLKEYIYVHVRTLTTCTFNNSTAIFALVTYVSGMQALNFNLDDCKWTIRDLGVYPYTSMYAGANTLQESLYPQHNIIA